MTSTPEPTLPANDPSKINSGEIGGDQSKSVSTVPNVVSTTSPSPKEAEGPMADPTK